MSHHYSHYVSSAVILTITASNTAHHSKHRLSLHCANMFHKLFQHHTYDACTAVLLQMETLEAANNSLNGTLPAS